MSVTVAPPRRTLSRARDVPPSAHVLGAVIRRGLRDRRRAPLAWGGALGVTGALFAAMWPSVEGSMDELLQAYPEGLKKAFGIVRLDSAVAYIDAELLSLIAPMALAFFAIRSVTRATVGAEESGHLDTLLSLPVARWMLVAGTFTVTGIVLAAILVVVWTLTFLAGAVTGGDVAALPLAAGLVNLWPLAMAFAGLAILCAGVLRRPAIVTAIATGTLVAMYVVDLLGKLAEAMEPFRAVSAFRYYGTAVQDGVDPGHAAGLIIAGVALAAVGTWLFGRRDIG